MIGKLGVECCFCNAVIGWIIVLHKNGRVSAYNRLGQEGYIGM